MKKPIIYSLLISLLLIGGAYYYFFILQSEPEISPLPSKVKLVMPPLSSVQVAKETSKDTKKEEKKPEIKKEEPKLTGKEEKKVEAKKEEPKKVETKEAAKEKVEEKKKEVPKKKEEPKKPRYYQVIAVFKNQEEAKSVKDNLLSLGYHTAKVVNKNGVSHVILSPFTDYYEADYVRKNIELETKRKDFKTKAVY